VRHESGSIDIGKLMIPEWFSDLKSASFNPPCDEFQIHDVGLSKDQLLVGWRGQSCYGARARSAR
jgi:hypothetical protein